MTKRKLLIALTTAALATAGFGASVIPASAEQKTLRVTLVTGQVITCTVDVSVDICPGIPGPVADVVEIPTPPPASVPEVPVPGATQPPPSGGGDTGGGGGGGEPSGSGSEPRPSGGGEPRPRGDAKRQKSTGEQQRGGTTSTDPRDEVEGDGDRGGRKRKRTAARRDGRLRDAGGAPTLDNPTLSIAVPGAAPIGVPNFFIDKFRIPPFLLSIYQAAGIEYGVRWEVLAAINEIETDYGRNLNVSSAGAVGWMQFMPATWRQYGVDANGDRKKDPY
ncbi:MAG TPA: lytic transglycosylase domain-containing protein, partial [Solirubrobacteraceae bacterium]|nr:lytic transglycosylase domain-containing protein [Solirubrobacteraceae bacterium]